MTRDDIIRMAREAGWPASVLNPHGPGVDTSECLLVPTLERFAALVAAAEREECAKVCDSVGDAEMHVYDATDSIRARGNT